MTVKELKEFLFEYYYRRIVLKDLLLLASKLIKQIPDTNNAKKNYKSFFKNNNRNCLNNQS